MAEVGGALSARVLARLRRLLIPLLGLLVLLLVLAHLRDREQDHDLIRQRGFGIVRLQTEIIERELEWAAYTLLGLAEDSVVVEHLSGDERRADIERVFQRFCTISGTFDQVRLIDLEGHEVARVDFNGRTATAVPQEELQSKRDRYYFARTAQLERRRVYLSPFDLNIERGEVEQPWEPVIRVATPCFDRDGEKRGIVVLNYLGADMLARLARAADAAPGWSALVNPKGYYLEAPAGSISWGFLFGAAPTFAGEHPDAWRRVVAEPAGHVDHADGLYTFRKVVLGAGGDEMSHRIDLGLHVVSFVPAQQLYAHSRGRLARMGWVATALVLLAAAASWRLAYVGALREAHERSLAESREQLRRLSARVLDAQEEERRRLSRDLHDDVGQLATALTIDLGRAERSEDPAKKDESIRRARDGTAQLLETVRRISASLRSEPVEDLGLTGAVRAYTTELEERTGLDVDVRIGAGVDELPSWVSVHLYRIVQEALANVIKHAEASEATVELRREDGRAVLVVSDPGAGFDSDAPTDGVGLLGMRERVEMLGGNLRIETHRGAGTRIEVHCPGDPEAPEATQEEGIPA